jgi:segregation and condensation protein A
MAIPVKLPAYEGPLDLLLHLIEKNKIDIYDIPIVEITNQYLEYIKTMEKEDLNIVSEFLLMAATLLDIKCKMLLPLELDEDGEETDPRSELVEQLIQYKIYKYISMELKVRQSYGEFIMYKNSSLPEELQDFVEPVDVAELLSELSLNKLNEVFNDVMRRRDEKIDPVRSKFGKIEKEEVPLQEKLKYVEGYVKKHKRLSFRQLLEEQRSKMHVVVTFLAILEMVRTGMIRINQDNLFDDILIEQANGFE